MEAKERRGRPRERSDDEKLARKREINRRSYERRKHAEKGAVGRKEKEDVSDDELEKLVKRRENKKKAKENYLARGRGRPRKEEGNGKELAHRERGRKAYGRKKDNLLKVALFPRNAAPLSPSVEEVEEVEEVPVRRPTSILRTNSTVRLLA